ncbi:unnamed protein product [Durusdinium trenchii]|uniref:Uncharacterized protein n=1 Tax=Durusdinium trenchii TaxID=1381693 RepID=A0ABP0PKY2_9DINO
MTLPCQGRIFEVYGMSLGICWLTSLGSCAVLTWPMTEFLMGELTTRRDFRFCRSISLTARLDLFLRTVISHCQIGSRYAPPEPSPLAISEKERAEKAKPRSSGCLPETVMEEIPPEIPGLPELQPEPKEEKPEHWIGYDGDASSAPRRWPEGYDQEVADW